MTPDEYMKLALRTECNQTRSLARLSNQEFSQTAQQQGIQLQAVRLNHSLVGIANELGELCRLHQKWIYYGSVLDQAGMLEEYGDLLWYISLGLNALGLTFSQVMEANIAKLKTRYPDKFTEVHALNRDPAAEARGIAETSTTIALDKTRAIGDVGYIHIGSESGPIFQDGHGYGHTTDPSHTFVNGFCTACACKIGHPSSFEMCPASCGG